MLFLFLFSVILICYSVKKIRIRKNQRIKSSENKWIKEIYGFMCFLHSKAQHRAQHNITTLGSSIEKFSIKFYGDDGRPVVVSHTDRLTFIFKLRNYLRCCSSRLLLSIAFSLVSTKDVSSWMSGRLEETAMPPEVNTSMYRNI